MKKRKENSWYALQQRKPQANLLFLADLCPVVSIKNGSFLSDMASEVHASVSIFILDGRFCISGYKDCSSASILKGDKYLSTDVLRFEDSHHRFFCFLLSQCFKTRALCLDFRF